MFGAFDHAQGDFFVLADVDHLQLLAGLQAAAQFGRQNFSDLCHFRSSFLYGLNAYNDTKRQVKCQFGLAAGCGYRAAALHFISNISDQ